MQVLVRNTGTLLRAAETPRGKMRAPRFEPPSRPDVPGGLLEARLTTNGGAGAPRTAQVGARAQQLNRLPTAYKTVRNAAPRNSKTEKKRRHPRSERAPLPH